MPKPLPITDEIQQIKARLRELQNQQLDELRAKRRELAEELAAVERQIADITGAPVAAGAPVEGEGKRKRAPKLPKLVKDSEEYKELGRKIQTILAKEPTGMNGKQIADALGYQQMNERNRHQGIAERHPAVQENGAGGLDEVLFAVRRAGAFPRLIHTRRPRRFAPRGAVFFGTENLNRSHARGQVRPLAEKQRAQREGLMHRGGWGGAVGTADRPGLRGFSQWI